VKRLQRLCSFALTSLSGLIQAILNNEYTIGMKAQLHEPQSFFDIKRVKMEIVHVDRPVVHVFLYDHFVFHDVCLFLSSGAWTFFNCSRGLYIFFFLAIIS